MGKTAFCSRMLNRLAVLPALGLVLSLSLVRTAEAVVAPLEILQPELAWTSITASIEPIRDCRLRCRSRQSEACIRINMHWFLARQE